METPENFDFPFPPYSIQHDFMKCLYAVLENNKFGIFESPTGTGKSLSIICGAIRWLKDHNRFERELLEEKICALEALKLEIVEETADWLSSQTQEINMTRQINTLKIQQNRIQDYDKKIEKLRETVVKKEPSVPKLLVEKVNNDEDEDMVLNDGSDKEDEEHNNESGFIYKPVKIFICSRTHSQLSQFVGEILKSPFAQDIRVVSLASRQSYCINPNVKKLKNNTLINERCLDMQKHKSKGDSEKAAKKQKTSNSKCPYFKQVAIQGLRDLVLTEVQDVEDLVRNGKLLNACPYYASRLAVEDSEVVLVPYNTILHQATRKANGIDLRGNVIIIDEAHNLLEAMAQMHNSELSYEQIEQGLLQMKCYKHKFNMRFSSANLLAINQLIFVVTRLQNLLSKCQTSKCDVFTIENFVLTAQIDNYNMFKLVKFCKDSHIAQKVRSYTLKYPFESEGSEQSSKKGVRDFLSSMGSTPVSNPEPSEKMAFSLSNPLLAISAFLESLTYSYTDGRIFIHSDQDKFKTKLQFLLLNPSQNFQDIVKEARAVIVAGGTMKPIEEFKDRLFLKSGVSPDRIAEFSCEHIIPPENILPIVVTEGVENKKLLFNYEHRMSMGHHIKVLLEKACRIIVGGIVVFFPSYNYEQWVWEQIKTIDFGRAVFREPQDSASVDSILKSYSHSIMKPSSSGALLLSVVGGKLSEGLNFSDDLGRCIILIGLPYANIMAPDLKEKMTYLDKTEGFGAGNKFYDGLCMKAVNQSIGRAVRHKNDFATILLVDERYNRSGVKNALPDWIKRSLKVQNLFETFYSVEKFFEARKKCNVESSLR